MTSETPSGIPRPFLFTVSTNKTWKRFMGFERSYVDSTKEIWKCFMGFERSYVVSTNWTWKCFMGEQLSFCEQMVPATFEFKFQKVFL